ncbi:MAG: CHAT domain-containing tetratricopeptide repeat protein [Acidobacteriota bacterium]|nr:CHAT domain-containing tetratricopeptide repeat protein [Acidobacteriota bacterium]
MALIFLALAGGTVPCRVASGALPGPSGPVANAQPAATSRAEQLLDRSAAHSDAGEYEEAVRDAREAARLYASAGDAHGHAVAINEAGLAQLYAGLYPAARASFEEALAVATAAGDAESVAEERMNLASVDFYNGRYTDAAAQYAAVARLLDAHRNEDWTRRRHQILLANQATLDQRLGRYAEAIAAYRLALSNPADLRPEEQAQMLANLGVVYRRMGDPYKALEMYDRARAIFAEHQQIDGELGVLKNRGIVLALDLNRLPEARATFAEALTRATNADNAREALQAQLYGAETQLRLGKAAEALRDFDAAYKRALELETVEEQWKSLYGLARCEMLQRNDDAATAHLRKAVAVIEQIREAIRIPSLKSDFFNDKREVFDALIALRLRHGAAAAELFDLIERGHSRGWRERVGLKSNIDLQSVQRALPRDAVLLDYWTSSCGAAVLIVTTNTARIVGIQVDRPGIAALASALGRGSDNAWIASAQRIGAQLLPPLPDGKPHVVIVTDGALASVPFELLPIARRPLVETHDVTYLPTAALLLRDPLRPRRWAPPWSVQFRGFADPLFGSAALDNARAVGRLTASAKEVRAIAAELGGKSILRIGTDDRKEHLNQKSDAPLLHIASHAFVDPGAIEQSRILFSAERDAGPATYLFLKEAYDLPLDNVELAVLSACETERGRAAAGEGIESFSRAFLAAGARSTVTTLWRVPDATTASFMRIFYHHLQRGASRAEALRRAKLRFTESGAPLNQPHYWAAFVLTGEGLQPVSTAMRWTPIVLGALTLVLVMAVALWFRRR